MEHQKEEKKTLQCDGCQKQIPRDQVRFMSLRTCCKVMRLPLCADCFDRYKKNS